MRTCTHVQSRSTGHALILCRIRSVLAAAFATHDVSLKCQSTNANAARAHCVPMERNVASVTDLHGSTLIALTAHDTRARVHGQCGSCCDVDHTDGGSCDSVQPLLRAQTASKTRRPPCTPRRPRAFGSCRSSPIACAWMRIDINRHKRMNHTNMDRSLNQKTHCIATP